MVIASLISIVSLIGFVLALVFQWPSHFVIGEVRDSRVTLDDLVAGTVTSIPLPPWIALVVFTLLASSRRWWGTLGAIGLCVMGVVFVIGGWGEAFGPPNPNVPRLVLLVAGIVYGVLGLSLSISAALDLIDRARAGRSPAR